MCAIKRWLLSILVIAFTLVAAGRCAEEAPPPCRKRPAKAMFGPDVRRSSRTVRRPSDTPNYRGYYVGGGAAVHGQPRSANEGTWGWDYGGLLPKLRRPELVARRACPGRRRGLCHGPQVIRLFSRQFPDGIEFRDRVASRHVAARESKSRHGPSSGHFSKRPLRTCAARRNSRRSNAARAVS